MTDDTIKDRMPISHLQRLIFNLILASVTAIVPFASACRDRIAPASSDIEIGPAGEPAEYSATIVCSVDDGERRELSVTRVARSGDMLREEWTEGGEARALIWRPDIGKSFLLAPSRRV